MPNIKVEFTPAGFDYVRRVLGSRPYDEAGPLIAELEQQRAAQEAVPAPGAPTPAPELPSALLDALKAAGGVPAAVPNGAASS